MNSNPIDTQEIREANAPQRKQRRASTKKGASTKKAIDRSKKPADKYRPARANKKADVVALMEPARGATLAEIMAATGW